MATKYFSVYRVGENMPVYKKKGPFWILLGALRGGLSNSSIPQNMFKKILFRW